MVGYKLEVVGCGLKVVRCGLEVVRFGVEVVRFRVEVVGYRLDVQRSTRMMGFLFPLMSLIRRDNHQTRRLG